MAREAPLKITVLGAGAWGTALANLAARGGREPRTETAVTLYARDSAHVAEMAATGFNARRLPGVPLLSNVAPTADLAAAADADVFLAVVPAQALRALLEQPRAADLAPPARRSSSAPRASNTEPDGSSARSCPKRSPLIRRRSCPARVLRRMSRAGCRPP